MTQEADLMEELEKIGNVETEIKVKVIGYSEEFDYKTSKQVIELIKPLEEEALKRKAEEGREVFERIYRLRGPLGQTMFKLITGLKACFYIEGRDNEITLRSTECPPCEPGAKTNIAEKHFLLREGKIVEKSGENSYKVYTCKVKPEE